MNIFRFFMLCRSTPPIVPLSGCLFFFVILSGSNENTSYNVSLHGMRKSNKLICNDVELKLRVY